MRPSDVLDHDLLWEGGSRFAYVLWKEYMRTRWRWKRLFVLGGLALVCVACGSQGWNPAQPDPVNENQAYMLGEVRRIEPLMKMGEFKALFEKPPSETYAGWAMCVPGGSKPPYVIGFNDKYVATLKDSAYMTALVAHEMCHHWVSNHGGSCWDEKAAENCAAGYAR